MKTINKLVVAVVLITGLTDVSFSQNSVDALRYSRIFYQGTSRFQGMGGAFGAVGADFSALAINPAGIGLYKSTEFTITPEVWIGHSVSDYNGVKSTDDIGNFALGNVGFVFSIKPPNAQKKGGFQNFNFGFGINRQNDFNTRTFISGPNNTSSLMTGYTNVLNNQPWMSSDDINYDYPFDIAPAYNANLIYYNDSLGKYTCDAMNGGVYQQNEVTTYGSINEFDMSFGASFEDKLYFGATFGIPWIRYYERSTYSEIRTDPSVYPFQSLLYNQYLETTGTGINLKVGVIYRPIPWFRVGVAVHTPTYYGNMKDTWNSDIASSFTDSTQWNSVQYSPIGDFHYQMATPFRAIGSMAFLIGNAGVFSAEYEFVDYNQARFYSSDESFQDVNDEIRNKYTIPLNLRFGTEWRIQNFRIRGGFGYYGSPYKGGGTQGERYTASGGIGYRGKYFFFDAGYTWAKMSEDYYLYDPALVNPSHNIQYSHAISTTFGVRF